MPDPAPSSSVPLWRAIRETLEHEIAEGLHRPGEKLPTEAALAQRFGVNRHTVRHALAALAEAGVVAPRRGAGVFVTARPTDYALGRRVRFHRNLAAAGRLPSRTLLDLVTRRATGDEAAALDLPPESRVHCYEGLSLADGTPIALFRSLFSADRFPDLPLHLRGTGSVTRALAACGLDDYVRSTTRLTARRATATEATLLRIAQGAPLLQSVGVNTDLDGRPVEVGRTWFVGDRVTLTLDGGAD